MDTVTQQYLYGIVDEEQRNILQHNVLKPTILKLLAEILENYGLRQRLEATLKTGSQVLIMEAGSGSGSFLHDFADFLNEHNLLKAANLNGLDLKEDYVLGAEQQNQRKSAWANINYYHHDITTPLEHNYSLKLEKKLKFDCICATVLLQYFPDAHLHVLNLYNYLKPGGVLYICDSYMSYDGEHPWIAPSPLLEETGRLATGLVRNLNGGKIIAAETAGWLREAGAEQVQTVVDVVQTGKDDQRTLEILRYYIAILRNVIPVLLQASVIDRAKHDQFMAAVFQLDRNSFCQQPFIHTLARKPL